MVVYKWNKRRLWIGLLVYWFLAISGASVVGASMGQGREGGWIILLMLVFTAICMITHRGGWKLWQRVLFIPATWLAQTLFFFPVALLAIAFTNYADRPHLFDRLAALLASIPVVLFAMRKSDVFVQAIDQQDAAGDEPDADHIDSAPSTQ